MIKEEMLKRLVGMTESAAFEIVVDSSLTPLVTRRDGEEFMCDMMMNDSRVKLEVESGIVVKATVG